MGLENGTRLGPYEILAPLGAGGMGEVYRARDSRLNRDVAVKVLPGYFAQDPDRLRLFQREARATAALNHPNILAVYDIGTYNEAPYVVSELLVGETLRSRLGRGALPVHKALDLALQIARGLAAAHHEGIVHRDLKPENVFITQDGRAKILDFGLARRAQPELTATAAGSVPTVTIETVDSKVLGTPAYMAPEQVRGQNPDARSDIFSFGAVLYEMLSGRRAFKGHTTADTMTAVLMMDPPDLMQANAEVRPALARVVLHCLEKSFSERFQSIKDVAFDLESLCTVRETAATSPLAGTKGTGGLSTSLPRAMLVGLGLLILGILAGLFAGRKVETLPAPHFQQLTFRRGTVYSARFAPDGRTVLYTAAWEGKPRETFSIRPEFAESRALGLAGAQVLAISRSGEMAVSVNGVFTNHLQVRGTLAEVPFTGGAPREISENVTAADWSPDGAQLAVARSVPGHYQIEFPIGKVLYETHGWVSDVRVGPRGDLVAFLDHPISGDDRGSVVVLDSSGNKRAVYPNWSALQGLAWSHTGKEVWFAASPAGETPASRTLYAAALSGKVRILLHTGGDLVLHDISPEGKVLLSQDSVRLASIAATSDRKIERDVSWLDWSELSDISRDGKLLLFSEQSGGGGPGYAVYIRRTDGSDAIRIGSGHSLGLSSDGKWATTTVYSSRDQLWIVPTGPGDSKRLENVGIQHYYQANWFSDGKSILFSANEHGHKPRYYTQDLEGGKLRPLTPDGISDRQGSWAGGTVISPDGKYFVASDAENLWIYPVDGGSPRRITGADAKEAPIQWTADGRALYLFRQGELPAKVYRLSIDTGKKVLWKDLGPSDATGVVAVVTAVVAPDGRSYAYNFIRWLSDLYVVDGLK